MKYAIGAIIGILIYHYYPSETRDLASKAGAVVHEGAKKAAEITAQ